MNTILGISHLLHSPFLSAILVLFPKDCGMCIQSLTYQHHNWTDSFRSYRLGRAINMDVESPRVAYFWVA